MSSRCPKKVPIVPTQPDTSFDESNFGRIPAALYLQQIVIDVIFQGEKMHN
jgi:hypothetical protein